MALKRLTTPLLRWLRVLCLFVYIRGTCEEPPTGLIPWFSKTEGNTYVTIAASPFPLQGKPTQAQDIARRIFSAVAGEVFAQVKTYQVPITNSSPSHLHYLPFVSRFPLPHFNFAVLFALSFPISSSLFVCLFLFACVSDYLLPWRKIIPNCVISRIPIIMIFLVLRFPLLMIVSLVKSILLC